MQPGSTLQRLKARAGNLQILVGLLYPDPRELITNTHKLRMDTRNDPIVPPDSGNDRVIPEIHLSFYVKSNTQINKLIIKPEQWGQTSASPNPPQDFFFARCAINSVSTIAHGRGFEIFTSNFWQRSSTQLELNFFFLFLGVLAGSSSAGRTPPRTHHPWGV